MRDVRPVSLNFAKFTKKEPFSYMDSYGEERVYSPYGKNIRSKETRINSDSYDVEETINTTAILRNLTITKRKKHDRSNSTSSIAILKSEVKHQSTMSADIYGRSMTPDTTLGLKTYNSSRFSKFQVAGASSLHSEEGFNCKKLAAYSEQVESEEEDDMDIGEDKTHVNVNSMQVDSTMRSLPGSLKRVKLKILS